MVNNSILFLTNNNNTISVYKELEASGYKMSLYAGKLTIELLKMFSPQLVVSYNYEHIISKDVIDLGFHMINLHISLLPWNKGTGPNIFSFFTNTPKGITIHQLSEGIDDGDIILQKEFLFNEKKETFKTTYEKLHEEIQRLLVENIDTIFSRQYVPVAQVGAGTIHTQKQLDKLMEECPFSYDEKIADVLNRYHLKRRK